MSSNKSMRDDVFRLLKQREDIEAQLLKQREILESNHVTMTTELVDVQGFPRADLDIPTIRAARNRIHTLLNDRFYINEQIEKVLPAALRSDGGTTCTQLTKPMPEAIAAHAGRPQPLGIRSVQALSPAAQAGLEAGDELLTWDDLQPITAAHMSELPTRVKEGVSISLTVQRISPEGYPIQLQLLLTPSSQWNGRGLLGCHIVPIH